MTPRFACLADFKFRLFGEAKRPSLSKLRRLCARGELPARRFGKEWIVDLAKWEAQGDPLVEKILDHVSRPS